MFSRKIEVRTTDAHSVVDRQTRRRLNPASSVTIGDHVWVGLGAVINKGSSVPADSVVGAMSFVNRSFEEEGVILAGIPAKVIRTGITWNRGRNARYTQEELDFWKDG
jgi:acetyltransferase-like isoleucine patch superfamily enzyme